MLYKIDYSYWSNGRAKRKWERIGEYTLSTTLHISWERGRVNLICSTIIANDVS